MKAGAPYRFVEDSPVSLTDPAPIDRTGVWADLSVNENKLGPSPRAIQAFAGAGDELWRYPDPAYPRLRAAIARHNGCGPDTIACGAGADELITLVTRLFIGRGDQAVIPEFSFCMFALNVARVGGIAVPAASENFGTSPDAILRALTPDTRAVFVANPNNPTGTYIGANALRYLVRSLPDTVILVLDEAYADYVVDPEYRSGLELVGGCPHLVVLRTFSKAFGLAAMRVGWCCASPAIVRALDRIRGPYNVTGPAQAAVLASLADTEHRDAVVAHTAAWRERLVEACVRAGAVSRVGGGNFVFARLPDEESAGQLFVYLLAHGVLTRRLESYGLADCLRITVGTTATNELLVSLLHDYPAGANGRRVPR